jgi:hypothetical protein
MDVMGRHAVGNKLSDKKISEIIDISPEIVEEEETTIIPESNDETDGSDFQPTLF